MGEEMRATWVWERDARVRDGPLGESKVASVLDFEPRGRERWEEKVRGLPEGKRLAGKGSPKEGAVRRFGGPERKRLSVRGNPKGAGTRK